MKRVGKEGDWAVWQFPAGSCTYVSRIISVRKRYDYTGEKCITNYYVQEFGRNHIVYEVEIKQFLTNEEAMIYLLEN